MQWWQAHRQAVRACVVVVMCAGREKSRVGLHPKDEPIHRLNIDGSPPTPPPTPTPDSRLGRIIEWVLIITILTNTANLIMATYPAGQYQPMACPDPICVPPKCPQVVCAPTERWAVLYVNVGIVLIFTIDYVARLVSVHGTEARVVHACDLAIDLEGNAIDMVRPGTVVLGWAGWID